MFRKFSVTNTTRQKPPVYQSYTDVNVLCIELCEQLRYMPIAYFVSELKIIILWLEWIAKSAYININT